MVIEITVDEDAISGACVEDDVVTFKVFAVVAGTTGEDVTLEVCVVEIVRVDDDVTAGICAFVVVTRGTVKYDRNS